MENVLNCLFSFIHYSALFITVFIFATFEIFVLFIHRRNQKILIKVHCRTPVDLSSDTLHDILAFFNRKSLSHLRSVNSRFNQTIQLGFATAPYLLLKRICYSRVLISQIMPITLRTSPLLLLLPFLWTYYYCYYKLTLSYHWRLSEGKLYIQRTNGRYIVDRPMVNKILAAKFVRFDSIYFRGNVPVFPELFLVNCLKLDIGDFWFKTADSALFSWTEILDFLFRGGETKDKCRVVHVQTLDPPSKVEYFRFVDSVIQRFTAATSPVNFEFRWLSNVVPFLLDFEPIWNDRVKQHLQIRLNILQDYPRRSNLTLDTF